MALSARILSIAALPAFLATDPLRAGVHLRWTHHAVLGFPNGPVELSRAVLDGGLVEGCERRPAHVSETGQGWERRSRCRSQAAASCGAARW